MKKTLLLSAMAFITLCGLNAQTVWNFSNAPFGASPTVTFTSSFTTPDGLTVGTDGTALFSMDANAKTIDAVNYTTRLKSGGGGQNVLPSYIPVTRYLSFKVGGASTIKIGCISSSSSATRTLIIVNADQSKLDSITPISGSAAATYTYNYTGAASTIYLYSRTSGLNYYYLSATNVVLTAINQVLADKGVSFNGSEILNTHGLDLEVYNSIGKKVAFSKTNISTSKFQKGVYVVKCHAGTLKIAI